MKMSDTSKTADQLGAMFSAINSGQDVKAAGEEAGYKEEVEESYVADSSISDAADGNETSIEDLLADKFGPQDTSMSSKETTESLPPKTAADDSDVGNPDLPKAMKTVTVTDSKGRKKNIEVDFNDHEQLTKYIHKAAGMRKFQAERDALKKQIQSLGNVEEASEKVSLFNELDTIYQQDGSAGLINRLAGSEDAYDSMKQQIIDEYEMRRSASPSELARMDYEKERRVQAKELERIRQENQQFKTSVEEKEYQATIKVLQSTTNSSFNKYRFSGKLDDPDQEHQLDSTIWAAAQARLIELEGEGVELSSHVVDKVFREKAIPLRKYINKQSRKKLKSAITRKKQESASNVQSKIKDSMASGGAVDQQKIAEAFKKGNGTSALLDLWAKAKSKK